MQPLRSADSIMWTIKFHNGNMQRFKFPIRTTPKGSIKPYEGKPTIKMADIVKPGTFTSAEMGGYRSGKKDELIRFKLRINRTQTNR